MSKLPKMEKYDAATLAAVPASYDPRTSQKACTGPVLDQGFCGSCWAFGATEAISDRLCLSKGAGASFVQLAPLDLTTCDSGLFHMEDGCQGGQLSGAWSYAKKTGLVEESCYPYLKSQGGPVPTCEPTAQPCLPESKFIKTPQCEISSSCKATAAWPHGRSWRATARRHGLPAATAPPLTILLRYTILLRLTTPARLPAATAPPLTILLRFTIRRPSTS